MKEAMNRAIRNIHVSKAVSQLKNKSEEYREFLEVFVYKYGEEAVKAALKELYTVNMKIRDIKSLTAAMIISNYDNL